MTWTIQEAKKSRYINNYIISTDDKDIALLAGEMGVKVIVRPKNLAKDDTPSILALQHAVKQAEKLYGEFDVIIELRCTNPLKTVEDIDNALSVFEKYHPESVIGVSPSQPVERIKTLENMYIRDTEEEPQDGQRQFLPEYWVRNGSFYIVNRNSLMVDGMLFGHYASIGYKMPKEKGVNIDDMYDWKVAEMFLLERNKNDLGS